MSTPVLSDFRSAFPELAAASDSMVTSFLNEKVAFWDAGTLGASYSLIVLLDTAHDVSLDLIVRSAQNGGLQAPTGPVASVSAAGVSTSFSISSLDGLKAGSRGWYQVTWYGRKLIRLRDTAVSPAYVSSGSFF